MLEQDVSTKETQLTDFLLAEYAALRDEILKRLELQHQSLSLGLIALGALIPLGVESESPIVILLYPIIVLFLAASWSQSDLRTGQIGTYIRENIEPRLTNGQPGWESLRAKSVVIGLFGSLSVFSARGLFLVTQVFVVLLCAVLFRDLLQEFEIIFVFVDLGVVLLTWLIMTKARYARNRI